MAEIIRKTSDLWVMRQFLKEEIGKKQYPIHLINPTHPIQSGAWNNGINTQQIVHNNSKSLLT